MTYKQNSMINNTRTTHPQTLGLHKNSHNITKTQPKIRIIHIHAPEIINTEVANFREVVQRLTGMPQPGDTRGHKGKGKSKKINRNSLYESDNLTNKVISHNIGCDKSTMVNTKLEVTMGPTTSTTTGSSSSPSSSLDDLNYRNEISNQHDNQDCWRMPSMDHTNNNSTGGYLTGLPEFDDHIDLSSMFTNNFLASADGSSNYFNSLDKY